MEKLFVVKSRQTIHVLPEDKKHIIISISCPKDTPEEFRTTPATVAVLRVEFDDIDERHRQYKDLVETLTFFNAKIAQEIISFVRKYYDEVECIICQCDAGISRSAGTAAALSLFYNQDDSKFFKGYIPNQLVYSTILAELGVTSTATEEKYKELWQRLTKNADQIRFI